MGTRADLWPLAPLIAALENAEDVELHVLTGVMYGGEELRRLLDEKVGLRTLVARRVHELVAPISGSGEIAPATYGPALAAQTAEVLGEIAPQVLVVLGDRWELLYVVPAAFLSRVPIVHLSGGDVTEGALDDRVRHAVTKLSDQHCVATDDSASRVLQMGESSDRVHVTGAPGLDRIVGSEPFASDELEKLLGRELPRPIALFTYHPPTVVSEAAIGLHAREALEATLINVGTAIVTFPGMDVGRDEVIRELDAVAAGDQRVVLVESLGRAYPRVLKSVDVVVGNSSSGVVEAASAGKPAVDVGMRQQGRLRGENVLHADEGYKSVAAAVAAALDPEFVQRAATASNPYGDGDAADKILAVVRAAVGVRRMKPFVDFPRGEHG